MLIETIFHHLFSDDDYYNKVYPHLKDKLFSDLTHTTTFEKIKWFSEKYSKKPEIKDIELVLEADDKLDRKITDSCLKFLKETTNLETSKNIELVVDETEKWVKARSMEVAILESVEILEKDKSMGLIEDKVKEALSISFKNDLGIEYFQDALKQFEFYTAEDENYPTDLTALNEAINGGFRKKNLYMLVGRTNIGKSLWMCHLASCMLKSGFNVIYFTAEMSENAITKRIDANVLNYEMDELNNDLSKKRYLAKILKIKKKIKKGNLFVKEYPTGCANKNNILSYLQELELKRGIKPDILIIDYVNIFSSSRLDSSHSIQTYQYMKAVTEEFRAIAVEKEVIVLTATQFSKEGSKKDEADSDLTGIGESWAISQTSDWIGAIIQSPEQFEEGKYLLKNLKTRFGENLHEVWGLKVQRKRMLLEDDLDAIDAIPINVRDTMDRLDEKRKVLSTEDDDNVFVFDEELG